MSLRLPSGRTGVFLTDPQLRGTVRAIADADKNATNMEFKTYDISPWGTVAADTGTTTRLRMAGQPYDQGSRLYHMGARYYDPDLGRFLSEDPIGISGGLNLYAYAGNDPVNAADPSGMLTCAPHAYRVPVTTVSSGGTVFSSDTAWGQAQGVGLDCWGDGDMGGSSVPGMVGSSKAGGPGGPGTMGRAPRQNCYLELALFAANVGMDALSIEGIGIAAKFLGRGGAKLLMGEALETGLTLNGGIYGTRVTGSGLVSGAGFGRYSRNGAAAMRMLAAPDMIRGSVALGEVGSMQASTAASPLALDGGGSFDWTNMIPIVGSIRSGKALWKCMSGK